MKSCYPSVLDRVALSKKKEAQDFVTSPSQDTRIRS